MRLFLGLIFILSSMSMWAQTTVTTQVHDLDRGAQINEETLVFLTGGQVVKLSHGDLAMLSQLQEAKTHKEWLEVTLNSKREVVAINPVASPIDLPQDTNPYKSIMSYNPSVISSPEMAMSLFKSIRVKHKDSQCFNRAHVWTYEWRATHNLFTSKVWLFFTRKYIRKYNFEWWFHVSPYFHVLEGGKVWERVVDGKYGSRPMKMKNWTDIFLRNDAECPVVKTYSEQANFPESTWCYVMKSSMYYYQPIDLEVLDKNGTERNVWSSSEVIQAYKEAFDIDV